MESKALVKSTNCNVAYKINMMLYGNVCMYIHLSVRIYVLTHIHTHTHIHSPLMVRETWVQSHHTKDFKKWYLIPPCLTLSNIRYVSSIKWSNPEKELHPPQHLGVVAFKKAAFWSPSTTVANVTYFIIFTQPLRSGRIWHKVNFLSGV